MDGWGAGETVRGAPPCLPEGALLARLAGDEPAGAADAFTQLYGVHYRPLLRAAAWYGVTCDVSRAQCEEFVADAMGQLWIQREAPPAPPLGAYLLAIVKRRILNARRDAASEARALPEYALRCGYASLYDVEGNLLWCVPPADVRALRRELYEVLARALDRMSPQRRGVLTDQYCDEWSVAESAESRGVAAGTVKKLRQLGGRELTAALRRRGYGDG